MKKVVKTAGTIAFMLSALMATASGLKPTVRTADDAKSLVFELNKQSEDAKLRMMDSDLHVIYSENINDKANYVKKFNMVDLKEGTYFLTIENSIKVVKHTLNVTEDGVFIIGMEEENKPYFTTKDDVIYLNFLNKDLSNVKLSVYDESGRILFEDTVEDSLLIQKAFNFKRAINNSYTVVVKDGPESYYKSIVVR